MGRSSRRFAHDKAAAGHPRRRLALMAHRGAAAGDQEIAHAWRYQHAVGQVVEAARTCLGPAPHHIARDMRFDRPAVDADGVGKACAGEHVVAGKLIKAGDAAGLADAELRRHVDDIGVGKAGRLALQELEESQRLAAAFDLAGGELVGIGTVERAAVGALYLGEVDAPLGRVRHRPDHAALARKFGAAGALGRLHQRRNGAPRLSGRRRVDAGEAEHHGGIEHVAGAVADLVGHAREGREITVARAVDEDFSAHGAASRLGLDDQRLDAALVLYNAAGEGVEQDRDAAPEQHLVGRAFIGRSVVGLRHGAAEDRVRRVEAAEAGESRQQLVGDAMHDLADLAVHIGMQPAEIGDAGRRPHAAEKAVTLDEERAPPECASRGRGGNAGRPAAEHDDVVFAAHGDFPRRLADHVRGDGHGGGELSGKFRHGVKRRTWTSVAKLPAAARSRRPPFRPHEIQAQAGALHVAVARAHRLGAAKHEVDSCETGIANALPQQCCVEAAAAERRRSGGIREIGHAIRDVERRRSRRAAIHLGEIERPARLLAPRTYVRLELRMVLFRDAPSGHIGIKVALHRLFGGDLLDIDVRIRRVEGIGFPYQGGMEARRQKPVSRELAPEFGVEHAGHDLEGRLDAVFAIPGEQRLNLAFVTRPQPDDAGECRQEARHQRYRVIVNPAIADADRISGNAFEHPHPRHRVGHVGGELPLDQAYRWKQSIFDAIGAGHGRASATSRRP